jgi:hypothetical protein
MSFLLYFSDFVVLQLDIGRFLGVLALEQEVMVFEFLQHCRLDTFHFVHLDGVFGLFLVEGLQQLAHDFPHFSLNLIPLELSDSPSVFLFLRHYFYLQYIRLSYSHTMICAS